MKGRIQIRSLDASSSEFRKTWKALEQGKEVKRQSGTYFSNLEAARKVLTPKRLELLRVIRREQPDSVYRLARLVGRDLKNVHQDIRTLAEYGLISLQKTRRASGRQTTTPWVRFKEIEIRIAV